MQKQLLIFLLALSTGCVQKNKTKQETEIVTTDNIPLPDTLTKVNSNLPEPWKRKAAAGIDFIATGNEPFWSIEIDDEKFIRYSTPDGIELTTAPVKAVEIDASTKLYKAETDMGNLELQIMNKICINDMSGDSSAYTVHLTIKLKKDEKPRILHGCGTSLKP
jgi:uncharacterized membrane protein